MIVADQENSFAPGFVERARMISGNHSGAQRELTFTAPAYLTDLGVREFKDPKTFFELNMKNASPAHYDGHEEERSRSILMVCPIEILARSVDTYILFTGDYISASSVISQRSHEILQYANIELLIYAGVIQGARGLSESLTYFDCAVQNAKNFENVLMATHRKAIVQIKRLSKFDEGIATFEIMKSKVEFHFQNKDLSTGDREGFLGMANNGMALAYVAQRDYAKAREIMPHIPYSAPRRNLRILKKDQATRYQAQENTNMAQLRMLNNEMEEASNILKTNALFCSLWAPNWLSEALSFLAYLMFLRGSYHDSFLHSFNCERLIREEASPIRLAKIREILVSSLHELGYESQAEALLLAFNSDPLGIANFDLEAL